MERTDSRRLIPNSELSGAEEAPNSESETSNEESETWRRFKDLTKSVLNLTPEQAEEIRRKTPDQESS